MSALRATGVARAPLANQPADSVVLDYGERLLRRKKLATEGGQTFWVDLPETVSLNDGDALTLEDGSAIAVRAAAEPLLAVTGDLPKLAWHIGNRHTPCQIEADRLLIQVDPVLQKMLLGLGAGVASVEAPFTPEGGAYGHGRVMGHDHGSGGHGHSHVHHHGGHSHPDEDFDDDGDGAG